MTELRSMYVQKLGETDFSNEYYRSENLKEKLKKKYNDQIAFCNLGEFRSSIVYHRSSDVDTAMTLTYALGSRDTLHDCGVRLHEVIIIHAPAPISWP